MKVNQLCILECVCTHILRGAKYIHLPYIYCIWIKMLHIAIKSFVIAYCY